MTGILVCGDNHFIVRGARPSHATALDLARHWSLIRIGARTPEVLAAWTISTREFRENLEWAIVIAGEGEPSPAVSQLLDEMRARGVEIESVG
ncbi:MAG: hypothetical protein WBY44_34320 [Bryobacteraceae bacterium]